MLVAEESAAAGLYHVALVGDATAQEWWIVYTIPATDIAGVGPILANKANRMGLKTDKTGATAYEKESDTYSATVAMKVRGKASS